MAADSIRVDLWDVGQGDCSVITLPSGELIIIDTGPVNSPLIPWLANRPSICILAVVITHNDADHVGSLTPLLAGTVGRVESVYMLREPQRSQQKVRQLFRLAFELHKARKLNVKRLEVESNEPQVIWCSDEVKSELRVVYPDVVEVETAGSANKASAILELLSENSSIIVWPGDNTIQQVAYKIVGRHPQWLFGPHHGAPLDVRNKAFSSNLADIQPGQVFISVGTSNSPSHPRKKYLSYLKEKAIPFHCTELTRQCDPAKNKTKPPILDTASRLGLWRNSSGVPCRGCVRLTIKKGQVLTDGYELEHQKRVSELRHPMCR